MMRKLWMVAVLHAFAGVLSAQVLREGNYPHSQLGNTGLVIFNAYQAPSISQWQPVVAKTGGYSRLSAWKIYHTLEDELGMNHHRAQLYYRGVPVEMATLVLHERNGMLTSLNGDLVQESQLAGVMNLSRDAARAKALEFLPADIYYWQDSLQNQALQYATGNQDTGYFPKGELTYCPKDFQITGIHRLAWKYNILATEPLFGKTVYVDAETGEILATEDIIKHVEVKGKATTKYSGNRSIQTDSTAPGSYRLREAGRGKGIETYNLKKGSSYGAAVDFTDADNDWNNVNANKDEVATDAHWGAEMTWDYYKLVHNRNSFDGSGAKILSYVHYGSNYNNAFWNGSVFTPLTGLDVCGHEITHAVTTYTAGLIYSYESGALNESFSDIFGNTIEAYARPTQWNWRIGEDITPSKNGIRSMLNPNLFNHPKFYKGVSWYGGAGDNGGVHYNSGVQNYWYYLIANGAKGTNEKGWSFQIDSLGFDKAGKIAYRNLSVYLTKSSQYADARTFSIMAAADLYGQCSREVIMVTNAWWVCGVGAKYDSGFVKADFRGDTLACNTSKSLKFLNLGTNYVSCLWYFGDGDTSTAINPSHTYNAYGSFNVKLVATSCFKSKKDSITRVQYVKVDSTRDICNAAIMPMTGTDSTIRCRGFIYDDGGEGNYGALKQINLKVKVPGADSIRFRFLVLDYETGYDSVVLFRNNLGWANKIGRYTGNALPFGGAWQTVKADALWLRQYSDPLVEGKGFKIEFEGIRPAMKLNIGNDTVICYGDSLVLTPAVNGGYAPNFLYKWAHGPVTAAVTVRPTVSSTYYLNIKDACTGKSVNDSIYVQVRQPLSVSLGRDTIICKGRAVRLNALAGGGYSPGYVYTWNQGLSAAATHVVNPAVTTNYMVVLHDGCTDRPDTAWQTVYVKPALSVNITAGSTPVCIGKQVSLAAAGAGGDTAGYLFTWNNGLGTGASKSPAISDTMVYIVTLTDGCTVQPARDTVTLLTFPALRLITGNDTSICRGSQVQLRAWLSGGKGSGYTYNWTGGKSTAVITETPATAGWYKVAGSDGCSPGVADSIRVDLFAALSLSKVNDTTLCDGQTLPVNLTYSGGKPGAAVLTWTPGSISGTSPVLNPGVGVNNYQVVLSDGCTIKNDTTKFNITRLPALSGSITVTPAAICLSDSVTIKLAVAGGKTASRTWTIDGVPVTWLSRKVKPAASAVYNFSLSDGCSQPYNAAAPVTVNAPATASLSVSPAMICEQSAAQFSYSSPDAAKVSWIFGPADSMMATGTTTGRTFKKAGKYGAVARVTTSAGCSSVLPLSDSVTVVAYPRAAFIPSPAVTNIEQPFILFNDNSTGGVTYSWDFGDGQSSATAGSVNHTYTDTGWFGVRLIISAPPGCADTASAMVRIKDVYRMYLPTSFTPDRNGVNDRYTPAGRGVASFKMKIFDRWGNKVFETNNMTKTWDGNDLLGKELMQGTYIIIAETIDTEGFRHEEKTTVQLIR